MSFASFFPSLLTRRSFALSALATPLSFFTTRSAAKAPDVEGMASTTCWFVMPSEYTIAFPTERQARRLERQYPDGLLKRVDGRLVWIRPTHYPAGWPKDRS